MQINQEQTPYPQYIDYEEEAIIEQVLRLSLDIQNHKTFSKANALPHKYVKLIKTMKMGRSKQKCSICIGDFSQSSSVSYPDQSIKRFPCNHIFHSCCAKDWLKVSKRCPLCRIDLEQHYQQLEKPQISKELLS